MRIEQTDKPLRPAPRRVGLGQAGFALPTSGPATEPNEPLSETAYSSPIAAMEVSGGSQETQAAHADQSAVRHGSALLDAMGGLQLALLGRGADAARATLATVATHSKQAADPKLNALLQAIAARAAVELARSG